MSDRPVSLRRVDGSQLPYVADLLAENDLPARDLSSKPECFYVARVDGDRVGAGGVEVYGPDGLLRSVVVEADARGTGVGSAICDELERRAADRGVERLYLLTTTAAPFFEDRGYEAVDRSAVPPAIGRTTEFADLCPDSAACLEKQLVDE
jgi:amino-acid N-acetyltransferase